MPNDFSRPHRATPFPGPAAAPAAARRLERWAARLGRPLAVLYGSRLNPVHQSGALAIWAFLIMAATGIVLFLFYQIDAPYASVVAIERELPGGSLLRALHRYAADLALVAAGIHMVKMFLQGRTWGPRALAWISGVALVGAFLLCGWTGILMMWDQHALWLARSLADMLDVLPILSEPLSRSFLGTEPVPQSFFFLNLFLHVAMPLGVLAVLWLHVARVARPVLLPPQALRWGTLAALVVVGLAWPAKLPPPADPLLIGGRVPLDVVYAPWLALSARLSPAAILGLGVGVTALFVAVPWLWRPRRHVVPPSVVDEDLCTGCTTCYEDCPFEAITMVRREPPSRRSEWVARVDEDLCVSCGICAGSCAPMGIGPPGRTGRDQLSRVQRLLDARPLGPETVVVFGCRQGAELQALVERDPELVVHELHCTGSLHSHLIEVLIRRGAAGVAIVACSDRDARFREGGRWLEARLHDGREAELKPRVDRRRVRLLRHGLGDETAATAAIAAFAAEVRALHAPEREASVEFDPNCDAPAEAGHG